MSVNSTVLIFSHSDKKKGGTVTETNLSRSKPDLSLDIESIAGLIANSQRKSGEIPWCEGKKTDPWDHVEAAMGLSIGGYLSEARRAFHWMAQNQNSDGSWYTSYRQSVPEDKTRDTNLTAYIAVGVFHYYLISGDFTFLKDMWQTVYSAIGFVHNLQTPHGDIYWAISPEGHVDPMALLTGCSSICMSIKCALAMAKQLGYSMEEWENALQKLEHAIVHKPHRFNMTKSRYAMDWFYPVLCGALTGGEARKRIDKYWKKFVIEGQGVRCVYDAPWVTIAETSELSLALAAMGNFSLAEIVFNWICDKRFNDGSYWCGFTFPDMICWPEDKITWTNGVALMAADAMYGLTSASQLFSHQFWNSYNYLFY
jgi:hypothetical protein